MQIGCSNFPWKFTTKFLHIKLKQILVINDRTLYNEYWLIIEYTILFEWFVKGRVDQSKKKYGSLKYLNLRTPQYWKKGYHMQM